MPTTLVLFLLCKLDNEEATRSDDTAKWKAAIDAELLILQANDTWTVRPLPTNRTQTKGIGCIQVINPTRCNMKQDIWLKGTRKFKG